MQLLDNWAVAIAILLILNTIIIGVLFWRKNAKK
jgi:hypothetical protein